MDSNRRFCFILCLFSLAVSPAAHAVLGGRAPASPIQSKAAVASQATVRYQSTLDDVVTVKEFVDPSGFVYAVTWEGPRAPDLNSLLGEFFPEYKLAIASTPFHVPRRRLMANSSNLHISQFGHPGAIFGIIYLKDRLPANVTPEDLK
jgi:Protein of unknown function (DUF2844)